LIKDGREFAFVLDAAGLGLRSVKLPETQALDPVEAMAEKAGLCTELEDAVHELFVRFMRLRLDVDAWSTEAAPIARWIDGTSQEVH
jgi:hypothetical protein